MGKLAELAEAKKLTGAVCVTFADGTTKTFKTEAEAEKATAGLALEHRRGAFFVTGAEVAKPSVKPKK